MVRSVDPAGAAKGTSPSSRRSEDENMVAKLIEEANIELSKQKELKTKKVSPENYKKNQNSILQAFANIVAEKPTPNYGGIKYDPKGKYLNRIKSHLTELHKNLSDLKNYKLTEGHKQEQDELILELGELLFKKVMTDTEDREKATGQCITLHTEISLCFRTTTAKNNLKTKMNTVFSKVKRSDLELQVGLSEAQANVEDAKAKAEANLMLSKIQTRLKIFDKIESLTFSDDEKAGLKSQIEALIDEVKSEEALKEIKRLIDSVDEAGFQARLNALKSKK